MLWKRIAPQPAPHADDPMPVQQQVECDPDRANEAGPSCHNIHVVRSKRKV